MVLGEKIKPHEDYVGRYLVYSGKILNTNATDQGAFDQVESQTSQSMMITTKRLGCVMKGSGFMTGLGVSPSTGRRASCWNQGLKSVADMRVSRDINSTPGGVGKANLGTSLALFRKGDTQTLSDTKNAL